MEIQEIRVNLDEGPEKRWEALVGSETEINELLAYYLKDLEDAEPLFDVIESLAKVFIPKVYLEEIKFISKVSAFSEKQVLVAKLYYDILKPYFGCTAFAIDNDKDLFHARNLDWHTENNMLGKYTTIFDFQKSNKTLFKSVG